MGNGACERSTQNLGGTVHGRGDKKRNCGYTNTRDGRRPEFNFVMNRKALCYPTRSRFTAYNVQEESMIRQFRREAKAGGDFLERKVVFFYPSNYNY